MPFPLDPKFIRDTEQKLSVRFPLSFRDKMIRDNGGHIEAADDDWWLYPFLDTSDKKRIARTCNDIVRETKQMKEWPRFPAAAVPIAGNGTGDQLIFLPRETMPEELGLTVFWWDDATGEVQEVADDFSELI
jgi:hypothetical protein